ncbi:MAG: sigma-70 family RNA polymerase sigma factor [Desulfuromusa sp.]|nr:sigma-70 family RNA polymerase sigma factor [Desulfuromusa sp.]
MTDEELMQDYAEGNLEAFELLYSRHKSRLFGYLLGKLRDRTEAEEVFQAVFVKLHRARARYRSEIPFLPWFFTIARNALIDHLRRTQTQQACVTLDDVAVANHPAPEQQGREPLDTSLPELASLSSTQRQVLELRFSSGLTFREIADQLQLSPVNVRQLASRAIGKLRRQLTGKEARNEE